MRLGIVVTLALGGKGNPGRQHVLEKPSRMREVMHSEGQNQFLFLCTVSPAALESCTAVQHTQQGWGGGSSALCYAR